MELDVIIGLVTIRLTIVVVGFAVAGRTRKLEEKIDRTSGELRDELRSEIGSLRTELGGRIDALAAELTRTRMAVARLEGSVFGISPPDTSADTA
ncbi:MAG: hypothetical protein F4164_12980 [Gemmatimonadales bacterium]|nr:hypothetical protein [Gemmatimonadales bacterium]MYK01644.1 hypothetical protein [Candidatus Palauibacter ramosifaciens]